MATLESKNVLIEITPCTRRSIWIETQVSITYLVPSVTPVTFTVSPENLYVSTDDVDWMFNKFRHYLENIPVYSPDNGFGTDEHTYWVSPTELGFYLKLAYGEYTDETRLNGSVSVEFMLSLRGFDNAKATDNIGCSLLLPIANVKAFMEHLETEFIEMISD